ncbi:hypothetical protein AYK25_00530 [Thermoplasmatales archaeon SM1-50]|nr:MAG: hypothetical protein AYK25_00530 [Thermoplasmatales archaeon SM1-50]
MYPLCFYYSATPTLKKLKKNNVPNDENNFYVFYSTQKLVGYKKLKKNHIKKNYFLICLLIVFS